MSDEVAPTVEELLAAGELADIRFLELTGTLREDTREELDEEAIESSMSVKIGVQEGVIETRVRIEVATRGAEYAITAAAQFHFQPSDLEISESLGREFAEKVGVMAIYPYLRESLQTLAARLREPGLTLPLMRTGEVDLGQPFDPDETDVVRRKSEQDDL